MSKTVEEFTRCPLASRIRVLTLDMRVGREKRGTKSSDTKSSIAAQSTNPEISCPSSKVFTFSSVRIKGRAAVSLVNHAVVSKEDCRSVAMEALGSCGGIDIM
jgi:hypothetical protein